MEKKRYERLGGEEPWKEFSFYVEEFQDVDFLAFVGPGPDVDEVAAKVMGEEFRAEAKFPDDE